MGNVSLAYAKAHLSALVDRVQAGHTIDSLHYVLACSLLARDYVASSGAAAKIIGNVDLPVQVLSASVMVTSEIPSVT